MSDLVRFGKAVQNGHEVVVAELFGVTVATSHTLVGNFDTEPDFTEVWGEYFLRQFVGVLIEKVQNDRGIQGWALATRLAPRPPSLPREGGE